MSMNVQAGFHKVYKVKQVTFFILWGLIKILSLLAVSKRDDAEILPHINFLHYVAELQS